MKKIFVRIARGKTNTTFHRAGMTFTKAWLAIGVDEATASCLYSEQMLEVTDVEVLPIVVDPSELGAGDIDTTVNGTDLDLADDFLAMPSKKAIESDALSDSTVRTEPVEGLGGSTGSPRTVEGQTVAQDALDTAKKKGKG